MFDFITNVFDLYLTQISVITDNLAIAIIVLAITSKVVLLPLVKFQRKYAMEIRETVTQFQESIDTQQKAKLNYVPFLLIGLTIIIQFVFLVSIIVLLREPQDYTYVDCFNIYLIPTNEYLNLLKPDPTMLAPIVASLSTIVSSFGPKFSKTQKVGYLQMVFPVMIFMAGINLPAGVSLYWIAKNMFAIVKTQINKVRGVS